MDMGRGYLGSAGACDNPPAAMAFRLLADLTVLAHLAFVAFAVAGGLLAVRWPRIVWLHLPAAGWAVFVELSGRVCPLTPLENWLRARGGEATYASGFVEQYLLPILYPASLSRELQWTLAALVVLANALAYAWVLRRRARP
jgi:hypothetical protein